MPGFSVPGIVGLILIGYGVFKANAVYGATGASVTLVVSAVAAVLMIRIALRSRALKKFGLDYSQTDMTAIDDYSPLLGMAGTTVSKLRPSGIATIGEKRYDVVTDGEFIDENTPVTVFAVDGTRIVVTKSEGR
ncbi:NfeD family protein [Candidatus Omnitrophota bacterium]